MHTTRTEYDVLGRATKTTDPGGGITTVGYDRYDNVVRVADPAGNETRFEYDAGNRRTKAIDPLAKESTFRYDAAGRLTSATDRLGRRRDFTYDDADRLTAEAWVAADGTTVVDTRSLGYDAAGNLLTAADADSAYTFTYDALDRVERAEGPWGLTLTYGYDALDRRTRVADSRGGVVSSVYDPAGRLTTRSFGGAGQTPLRVDLTWTDRDQLATVTRSRDAAGTQVVGTSAYGYDPVGRLEALEHRDAAGAVLADYAYDYDLAGRLTTETTNGVAKAYGYDAADQLTADGAAAYSYDAAGNRTTAGYVTGPGNRLESDGTWGYQYDAEGNLVGKTLADGGESWAYGYDHDNRMVWAERRDAGGALEQRAEYRYDALGNRIEKAVAPAVGPAALTRFAYDGGHAWAELDGSGALLARRLYLDGIDQVFARIGADGEAAWYLTDRLGSVRDVTDAAGAVRDHLEYDAFGNVLSESDPAFGDRYKFTGREYDAETGLQYNRARYYDAGTGRWTSEDPLGFAAGDANLYRYAGNGPTNATDPSGLQAGGELELPPSREEVIEFLLRDDVWHNGERTLSDAQLERLADAELAVLWLDYADRQVQAHRRAERQRPITAPDPETDKKLADLRARELARQQWEEDWDAFQGDLDLFGVAEPTPFADLLNAGISFARGRPKDGFISLLGVIPYVGDAAKGNRIAARTAKALERAEDAADAAKARRVGDPCDIPASNAGNGVNAEGLIPGPGKWARPTPQVQMKTRDLITQVRKENGFTSGSKWPKADDIPRGGLRFGRRLKEEELLALSEHYVAEFAQVTMKDGTVRLFKGPSSGAVRGGGGKEVEILMPEGAKSKIVRIDHTHPSRDPSSWASSEADRNLLIRYRKDYNPGIEMRIITRSWDGKIIGVPVVP